MRTIVEHAAYELWKADMTENEDPAARQAAINTMALVRRFEKMNMDERQAKFVLEAFETLCMLLPLTPITTDPEEWDKFEIDKKNVETNEIEKKIMWQSRRATSIFSEDEGKTFFDQRTGDTGESVNHIEQAEKKAAAKKARQEAEKRAKDEANRPKPVGTVAPEIPAGEATMVPEAPAKPEAVDKPKPKASKKPPKKETK